ncbi:MAG: hypothetical protein H0W36_01115 [Gemmatimonadetes bacterium]|nr:hypothetical protein [Gemmatimonadota bacterium]
MRSEGRHSGTRTALRLTAALLLAAVIAPPNAHAYIDPVSGSAILQALAAGVLAGIFMLKSSWHRVKDGVRNLWQRLSR